MLWFRKFITFILLATGIALQFLQFPVSLAGERIKKMLILEIENTPYTRLSAAKRFGADFIELSYERLSHQPEVREVFLGLMDRSGGGCVSSSQWASFLSTFQRTEAVGTGIVFSFNEGIYRINSVERLLTQDVADTTCLEVSFLARYIDSKQDDVPQLSEKDFMDYPGIKVELEGLLKGTVPNEKILNITPKLWKGFAQKFLDQDSFRPAFTYNSKLFISGTIDQPVPWTLKIPWLKRFCQILGAMAILLGIAVGISAHRLAGRRQGIPVASVWLSVLCDTILLSGSVFFFALFIDSFWIKVLGQPSLLGIVPDWPSQQMITGLHFVSIPAVFIALPLLSLWFTSLSAQRIHIDEKGITSFGALGSRRMEWTELKDISVEEQQNPFAFTVVDFRSLQRVLSLKGVDKEIIINQPSSSQRKVLIIHFFKKYAPQGVSQSQIIKELDKW
ncbi:hypothetical protein [Desulfocicer niacini]